MQLVLIHKPKPINNSPACGGRVTPFVMQEIYDSYVGTHLPLNFVEMLYADGMSLHGIAQRLSSYPERIRKILKNSNVVSLRRVGRPTGAKTKNRVSLKELGKQLGVSAWYLSQVRHGKLLPNAKLLSNPDILKLLKSKHAITTSDIATTNANNTNLMEVLK